MGLWPRRQLEVSCLVADPLIGLREAERARGVLVPSECAIQKREAVTHESLDGRLLLEPIRRRRGVAFDARRQGCKVSSTRRDGAGSQILNTGASRLAELHQGRRVRTPGPGQVACRRVRAMSRDEARRGAPACAAASAKRAPARHRRTARNRSTRALPSDTRVLLRVIMVLPLIQRLSALMTPTGSAWMARSSARAGPVGSRRPCSQLHRVASSMPISSANLA
jgi:hypothetical protein